MDKIKVSVHLPTGDVNKYILDYEDLAKIQNVLDNCTQDLSNDEPRNKMDSIIELMAETAGRRRVVLYDLAEKPTDMDLTEVINLFESKRLLAVDSSGKQFINTKILF